MNKKIPSIPSVKMTRKVWTGIFMILQSCCVRTVDFNFLEVEFECQYISNLFFQILYCCFVSTIRNTFFVYHSVRLFVKCLAVGHSYVATFHILWNTVDKPFLGIEYFELCVNDNKRIAVYTTFETVVKVDAEIHMTVIKANQFIINKFIFPYKFGFHVGNSVMIESYLFECLDVN